MGGGFSDIDLFLGSKIFLSKLGMISLLDIILSFKGSQENPNPILGSPIYLFGYEGKTGVEGN